MSQVALPQVPVGHPQLEGTGLPLVTSAGTWDRNQRQMEIFSAVMRVAQTAPPTLFNAESSEGGCQLAKYPGWRGATRQNSH